MDKHDHNKKAAAVELVGRGYATIAEVAELAGVSHQIARFWVRNLDWKAARRKYLARLWNRRTARE